ncbi:MAG: ABC transporter permease [Rhodospirillaceae bacterium]|nr:ABC transporter permease [Rhodospirillaceae bacterium]
MGAGTSHSGGGRRRRRNPDPRGGIPPALDDTRAAYYERYAFADVFAQVRRAPEFLTGEIASIPGVAAVETHVMQLALLDIPNFSAPATGQFISIPEKREQVLNRLYMRQGRMPDPASDEEVVVNEDFAAAHGFTPGSRFAAILNGRLRELVIVGTALSPEFIFAVGPGDIMPDNRRFAIVWMPEKALAAAFNLKGAFSSVSLKLLRNASEPDVIQQLDAILEPYGGTAAYGRKDQTSHAWIDHELDMLNNLSRTLPPIFLLVTAFLVNLTLTRLVVLEREQVGLLKAVGYSNATIAGHYLKFVILIALLGVVIGSVLGTVLGSRITTVFGDLFRFPFLIFSQNPAIYLLAVVLSLLAAILGALRAVNDVVKLPPAIAMLPPAPSQFRHFLPERIQLHRIVSQSTVMMFRNITHHPLRTAFTTLGIALATGILVVSLFITDTMDNLIDVTYSLADRQDATVSFGERRSSSVLYDVARLPGVIAAEARRSVPVRIRYGSVERRIVLGGYQKNADLSRIIDVDLQSVTLPESGLAVSSMLAQILGARVGDVVEVDLLEGQRRTVALPIATMVEDYFGIRAMMEAGALSRVMREAPTVSSVDFSFDPSMTDALYAAVKRLPTASGIALQNFSRKNFQELVALLVTTMGGIYAGLATIIAFGVVYNNARISLSERARDLASLRVLGFKRGEVLRILLLELALLTLIAQPLGWAIGYGLAWVMRTQLAGEIMRVRLVVEHSTYGVVSLIIILAAGVSALVVRSRVNGLDLISVLKTRD